MSRYCGTVPLKGSSMKSIALRSVACAALVAALALGAPAAAFAGSNTPTTTFQTLRAYQVAEHAYQAQLRAINVAFVQAVAVAKSNFEAALSVATSSSDRITARASMRFAIADATNTRANALTALGKAPVKPRRSNSSFH